MHTELSVGTWIRTEERSKEEITHRFNPKEPFCENLNEYFALTYLEKYGYCVTPSLGIENPQKQRCFNSISISFFKKSATRKMHRRARP